MFVWKFGQTKVNTYIIGDFGLFSLYLNHKVSEKYHRTKKFGTPYSVDKTGRNEIITVSWKRLDVYACSKDSCCAYP